MNLFGADLNRSSKRYKLSTAYVRLFAEINKDEINTDENSQLNSTSEEFVEIKDFDFLSIDDVLFKNNKVLLIGPAGSGKTTLVQWIAVMSAGNNLHGKLNNWNTCIPFLVRLREFANKPLPKPEHFPELISPALSEEMPKRWVNNILRNSKAIILVDGVDEISDNQRGKIKEWLADIDSVYPNNKWIVTARPYAVDNNWLSEYKFLNASLQEMNIRDVEIFIKHWHHAVKEIETELKRKEEIDFLQKKLYSKPHKKVILKKLKL